MKLKRLMRFKLKMNFLLMLKVLLFFALIFFFTSCMTVDRRGRMVFDSKKGVQDHNIIEDKILPYIAEVLDYNNPYGVGGDPEKIEKCRRTPTKNNMNYDKYTDCQDYALLFYALCKHYGIECKLVGNNTLRHAYNQVYRGKKAIDIEPQSSEGERFYINSFSGHDIERSGLFFKVVATHPDNILMDIEEWNKNPHASPANMELFNYVVEHGHLPDQPMPKEYPVENLFFENYVGMFRTSCGYNFSFVPSVRKGLGGMDRTADQMIFDFNYLDIGKGKIARFSYALGADLSFGARIREADKTPSNIFTPFMLPSFHPGKSGSSYPAFSSRLSGYALVGVTFNREKKEADILSNLYFTALVGMGVSISTFGKEAFSSFYIAYSLDLQYFFSRNYGINLTFSQTYDVAFFDRYGSNFMIKIGPTIRLHGQPEFIHYSRREAKELERRTRKAIKEMRSI